MDANREVINFDKEETCEENINDTIPSNHDFICYQNVEDRVKALYLVVKYMFDGRKGYKYLAVDRGGWKTIAVYPKRFLWEGILSILPLPYNFQIFKASNNISTYFNNHFFI